MMGSQERPTRKNTKSTKGTKDEITQILQTHSGDRVGNRPRVAASPLATQAGYTRNAAASRAQCRRDRKTEPLTLTGLTFSESTSLIPRYVQNQGSGVGHSYAASRGADFFQRRRLRRTPVDRQVSGAWALETGANSGSGDMVGIDIIDKSH